MLLPDVTAYLQAQGIGTSGTNLFYGILPDTPDSCVVIYEYPGEMMEPKLGKGVINLEFPRLQVLSRGAANIYDAARTKIQDVSTAFALVANQTIGGSSVQYKAIEALQSPFFLRRDENFRVIFACNFRVTKEYSTT